MTYLDDGEDGAEADSNDEHQKKHAVQARMPLGVEDGEKNEAATSDERAKDGKTREDSFSPTHDSDESGSELKEWNEQKHPQP